MPLTSKSYTVWNKEESDRIIEGIIKNPSEFIAQVNREHEISDNYMQGVISQKKEYYQWLLPQPSKEGMVVSRMLYKTMNLWMSINVLDDIIVDFVPKNTDYVGWEIAQKTRKVAKFDYELMNKFETDTQVYWDAGFLGAGIEIVGDDFDELENFPIIGRIDPLTVKPDPFCKIGSQARWLGFHKTESYFEIKNNKSYIQENVKTIPSGLSDELKQAKSAREQPLGYIEPMDTEIISLYHTFTIFNGRKYIATLANERGVLLRLKEIEPKTAIQKQDITRVKFPFVIYRMKYIDGGFFGPCIPEEILQFQKQSSLFKNLRGVEAQRQAFGPDRLVDTSIVDINDVANKKVGGLNIPVKRDPTQTNWDISKAVMPLDPGFSNSGLAKDFNVEIDRDAEETTGFSSIAFGVSPEGNQTKGEIQALAKNINQLMSYATVFIIRAEKEFWSKWYESYIYNMDSYSKKNIIFSSGDSFDSNEFTKKDFVQDSGVFIEVKSKSQVEALKKQKFASMMALGATILPNLNKGSYGHNQWMRKLAEYGGLEPDEIKTILSYSPDEIDALEQLVLLYDKQEVKEPTVGQDYLTYITIYRLAPDSPAKQKAIRLYMEAYKISKAMNPQMTQPGQDNPTTSAQMGNAITSDLAQKNQMPSISDISGLK